VITATQAPEKYLEIFDQLKTRMAQEPRWLQSLRQEAFARFAETGRLHARISNCWVNP
jgi:hypothetical protein